MRLLTKVAGVVAGALLATTLIAAPASANTSQGFIAGAGTITDDFGDEGTLSTTQHANSGATGLWQWILWADGAKKANGNAFALSDIDFSFGSDTKAATISWQKTQKLSSTDGQVGTMTFSRADNFLVLLTTCTGTCTEEVEYKGRVHNAYFARIVFLSGEYYVDTLDCYNTEGPESATMSTDYNTVDWFDASCND